MDYPEILSLKWTTLQPRIPFKPQLFVMRKLSVLFLFMLGAGVIHAQTTKNYTSGIKAGVNLANLKLTDQPDVSTSMRINFHAGIFYNVPLSSNFSIQPEILFSGEGAKFETSNSTSDITLNYLQVPVMFQFNTSSGFYLEAGPWLGIMAKGKEIVTTSAAESKLDLKKQYKKTNFGAAGGLGFKMKRAGIYARYNLGLADLAKTTTRPETKSQVIQVGLSWSFKQ